MWWGGVSQNVRVDSMSRASSDCDGMHRWSRIPVKLLAEKGMVSTT
jgi:hypothetical protein